MVSELQRGYWGEMSRGVREQRGWSARAPDLGLTAAGERGTSSLSLLSLEEESETGERMDSGTGARAVAESL